MRIDLNSDVGEALGPWPMGDDEALMPALTSANIACGFHAGDPTTMRRTLALAARHHVAAGAHPGFPDLVGFGRRELGATPADVEDMVAYQVAALAGLAAIEGTRLSHVKPHGALYNMACRDADLARAVARAVAAVDVSLVLFGLPGSALLDAGVEAGLDVAAEAFADRAYTADGRLASRRTPGSVLTDPAAIATRAVRLVTTGEVDAVDGSVLRVAADTLCVHGDTPGAARILATLRASLEAAGVRLAAPGTLL